ILGRPGRASCAEPARPTPPLATAVRHPRDSTALAPRPDPTPLDGPPPYRPATDPTDHPAAGAADGRRQPRLGLPKDPRRTGRARPQAGALDRLADPAPCRHRPGAARSGHDSRGLPTWRPSTATSCRSTKISTF